MKPATSFGVLLKSFFVEHLISHRRLSPQTITSYRDTFRLLLKFLYETAGIMPSNLSIENLAAPVVLSFLNELELKRGNCVRSRNARLAAIRSFFRFVVFRDPESVSVANGVLAIPIKRADHKLIGYLTRSEIQAILDASNRPTWTGRRDHAMLLTFYNTGARLSEITGLRRDQVHFAPRAFLHLHGKGRKEREVPLWSRTAQVLKRWFDENSNPAHEIAFPNARGGCLSSDGVSYILREAVGRAAVTCPSLAHKRVTPHTIRHSTAMHLLQAGVDISVIALWLGHESIETTHAYIEVDLTTKERALQRLAPLGITAGRYKPADPLMAFLSTL